MTIDPPSTDILNNLNTAVLLLAPDETIDFMNTAAQSLLNTSSLKVVGTPINELFADSEQSIHLPAEMASQRTYTKRAAKLRLVNGDKITADYTITPVLSTSNGELESVLVEMQPLDRLLRFNRDQEILASQQKYQTMVRGLAHEIKNPLGGLRGAAQLLEKELDESLADYTGIIIEEADRLTNLVDRLLGPNKRPTMQTLNIHEVLERVAQLADVETEKQIAIKRDYDPSIPELSGDKEQLIQAVLNITRNAIQALLGSNIDTPTIVLKTRALTQHTIGNKQHRLVCQITISDNGPGIDTDLAEQLFLPMVTSKVDGNGLGLSIAQSIVNVHQGLIEFTSEPGKTDFIIYLPLP